MSISGLLLSIRAAQAGPNLVANGDLNHRDQDAKVRESAYDNTQLIYSFDGEADFGRVVVRCKDRSTLVRYQRGLQVAYREFGKVSTGGWRGLVINPKEVQGGNSQDVTITIYLALRGRIRPGREYDYAILPIIPGRKKESPQPVKMIIPGFWADGELMGAEVEIPVSEWFPIAGAWTGRVRVPEFERITGEAAFMIQYPANLNEPLILLRVSLREVDEALTAGQAPEMPVPVRYIPIEDPVEDRIVEAVHDSTQVLQKLQNDDGYFAAGDGNDSVSITSLIFSAFAENGNPLNDPKTLKGLAWLAEQERDEYKPVEKEERGPGARERAPQEQKPKIDKVATVAARLYFFARYADVERYGSTVAGDIAWLEHAQRDDGGWAEYSHDKPGTTALNSDHVNSAAAVVALREAHFAGKNCRPDVWVSAARYWTESQAGDGGFRSRMDKYGGLNEATSVAWTALGTAGLMMTSDMAYGAGGRTCNQYKSNRSQIEGMSRGLGYLDERYEDLLTRTIEQFVQQNVLGFSLQWLISGRLNPIIGAFIEARYLSEVAAVSGKQQLNGVDHLRTEADTLLRFLYDRDTGLFVGSPYWTAIALETLSRANSSTVIERMVVRRNPSADPSPDYLRDAEHMMRYLMRQRKHSFNWRHIPADPPVAIEELVRVPILYVNFVGPFDWTAADWKKLRDYCFEGGALIVNIADDFKEGRAVVESGLRSAFPEYELKDLPKDDRLNTIKEKLDLSGKLKVLGNGVKNFVFVTNEDWSCAWHLDHVDKAPAAFGFVNNLLEYTSDGEPLPGTFTLSHYQAAAQGWHSLNAEYVQVGSATPLWPDLLNGFDRAMRANYRTSVKDVSKGGGPAGLTWISCTGEQPLNEVQKTKISAALHGNGFVVAEVVSGAPAWAESLRAEIRKLDPNLNIRLLPLSHPLFTGEIEGSQGFFVQKAPMRKTLRDTGPAWGRVSLYAIEIGRKEVGVLCEHDLSSGFSYALYPECRGPLPAYARRIAMNVMLYAMQRQLPPVQ